MSCTAVAIALSVLGGSLEVAGLVLVVREILEDRRRAEQALGKPSAIEPPERSYPAPLMASGAPSSVAGGVQSTEHELRSLAGDMEKLAVGLGNVVLAMRKKIDAELDQAVTSARQEAYDRDAELRGHLHAALAGSLRQRAIGAGLLFLGIVFATAGSVVGALAS